MRCKKHQLINKLYDLKEYYDTYLVEDHNDLHIILDDGNVKDKDIESCKIDSLKNGNYVAAEICSSLEQFTEDERDKLVSNNFNNYCL